MEPNELKDRTIEDVLSHVRNSAHADSVPSVAALNARLTIELAGHLHDVWAGLHDVKAALVNASTEASRQTAALVRWTKVLAWVTGAYTIITGGLLIVSLRR